MAGIEDVLEKIEDFKIDIMEKLNEIESKINADKIVSKKCYHCGGDGIKSVAIGEEITCPDCNGVGTIPYGKISSI